jgi:hypothetical protein
MITRNAGGRQCEQPGQTGENRGQTTFSLKPGPDHGFVRRSAGVLGLARFAKCALRKKARNGATLPSVVAEIDEETAEAAEKRGLAPV